MTKLPFWGSRPMSPKGSLRLQGGAIVGTKVEHCGIDSPDGVIVAVHKPYLAVRYPAHSYWTGRGLSRGHAPAKTEVYRITQDHERLLSIEAVLVIDHGKPKA